MSKEEKQQKKAQRKALRKENKEKYIFQLREHTATFAIYLILRLLVIAIMVAQFFNGNFENVFLCVLTLILFTMPALIQAKSSIELPGTLEIIILLFIFSAEILGEIKSYYIFYPFWDTMLHTLNGFLTAAIGFSLVDILNRNTHHTFALSPFYMALVAFCFSMTIGVLWEFFECFMDLFFKTDMQKDTIINMISTVTLDPTQSNIAIKIYDIKNVLINGQDLGLGGYLDIGLFDTMKDLFVNFVGAVIFSFIGFFYVKNRGKGNFAKRFIPQFRLHNPDK